MGEIFKLQWFIVKEWWGVYIVQGDKPVTKATCTTVPTSLADQPLPTATIALRDVLQTGDF